MIKKAFIVGINYIGTGNDLKGCINDAINMKTLLEGRGFTVEMCLEKDATTSGIKAGLARLVSNVTPGDIIVFHYSGHGSQLPSTSEADGYEEIICPIDLNWTTRVITDDTLRSIFNPVPNGVNTTVILDCCHSGDALDHDEHDISTREVEPVTPASLYLGGRYLEPPPGLVAQLDKSELVDWCAKKDINASALLLAGCKSDQTSADAYIDGMYQGAATASILAAIKNNSEITYKQLVDQMNDFMITGGYEQRPELDGFVGLHGERFIQPFGYEPEVAPVLQPDDDLVITPVPSWIALYVAFAAIVIAIMLFAFR